MTVECHYKTLLECLSATHVTAAHSNYIEGGHGQALVTKHTTLMHSLYVLEVSAAAAA